MISTPFEILAVEGQKEVNLNFIDYFKAFDRVRHNEIITQLTQLKINEKLTNRSKACTSNKKQQLKLMEELAHLQE